MLLLASKSPRRREILTSAGIPFEVRASDVPEVHTPGEAPAGYVQRLARSKAEAVPRGATDIVLGADTVVVAGDRILEKPSDPADAAQMLRILSGRYHEVITGICLVSASREIVDVEITGVHFVCLTEAEIEEYAASGEPLDKAGAYAIQGLASKFIDRIDGDYFNIVGLPVARVYRHWKSLCQELPSSSD